MEGKILVSSRKELATILGQTKEEGEMLEYVQSLFHPFEGQSPSDPGDLFLPAFTPILSPLIRDIWAANGFITPFIGFPLATVPEKALHHLHRFTNTLAEKSGQESKGTGTHGVPGFAKRTFYPNYQLPTPSAIKAMPNDLIPSSAVRAEIYLGKVVIFSLRRIILDRDTKIVYDHPWLQGALEDILCRISTSNPEQSSRALLFIGDLSE